MCSVEASPDLVTPNSARGVAALLTDVEGRIRLEAMEQRVRESFARQGLMQTMFAELTVVAPGMTEIQFPYAKALSQQNGYVHAAAVTAVLDSGCGYAAYTLAPEANEVLTVEFRVNLLAPAAGERFVARAQVKRAGKTLAVCSADAFAMVRDQEKLIATMLATIMYVPLRDQAEVGERQNKSGAS